MKKLVKQYLAYRLSEKGVGSRTIEKLGQRILEQIGEEVEPQTLVRQLLKKDQWDNSWNRFVQFIKELDKQTVIVKTIWDSDYPKQLKQIDFVPTILFCRGDVSLLQKDIVAVVGTRGMSNYGRRVLQSWLDVKTNTVIVSGLADGVDSMVHKMSLKNDVSTIAVVAGGIDMGFPRCNEDLYNKIGINGLVLAEFPPGRSATRGMYPMRNRIIAALARVIIVVESRATGGSLITADYGSKFAKSIYAVPGDVFRATSVGCNKLLSSGAKSISTKEDFVQLLNENQYLSYGDDKDNEGRGLFGSSNCNKKEISNCGCDEITTGTIWMDDFLRKRGKIEFLATDVEQYLRNKFDKDGVNGTVEISNVVGTKVDEDGKIDTAGGSKSIDEINEADVKITMSEINVKLTNLEIDGILKQIDGKFSLI